jgi:hypothetical protein
MLTGQAYMAVELIHVTVCTVTQFDNHISQMEVSCGRSTSIL